MRLAVARLRRGSSRAAGEPQGRELDGKAQAIVRPPAQRDDGEISRAGFVTATVARLEVGG